MHELRPDQVWLFWDGDCGFCRRAVAWVKQQDTDDRLRAVPYQQAPRPPMTDALAVKCERAVQVITPRGVGLASGRASLYILGLIGWKKSAAVLSGVPLVWVVEAGYWLVARNRRWFSRWMFRT